MATLSEKDILMEIEKQIRIFSIKLDFDDLVKRGVLKRKKGSTSSYAILTPADFPMEAVNQSNAFTEVTTKKKANENTRVYFKFPSERQRLKTLDKYKAMRERLSY